MELEVQVIPDALTEEERERDKSYKEKRCARLATCLKCQHTGRGVSKKPHEAAKDAVKNLAASCPEGAETHKYIPRRIPPGVDVKVEHTDGKLYSATVRGWTVYAFPGEISKLVPVHLVAQPGCDPDRLLATAFGFQLARRGYKVHLFGDRSRVVAEPMPSRKRKPKAKPPEPNAGKSKFNNTKRPK